MLRRNISQTVREECQVYWELLRLVFRRGLIIRWRWRPMKKRWLSRSQRDSTHSNLRFFYRKRRSLTTTTFLIERNFRFSTRRRNISALSRTILIYGKGMNPMKDSGLTSMADLTKTKREWGDPRSKSRSMSNSVLEKDISGRITRTIPMMTLLFL